MHWTEFITFDHSHAELVLMADLHPFLTKRAQGRNISGLSEYE